MWTSLLAKCGIYQNPEDLRDDELEAAYLVLRKEANSSNPHEVSPYIYRNRTIIIRRILSRHDMYYSDINNSRSMINEESIVNSFAEIRGCSNPEPPINKVLSDLRIESAENDILLYICFYIFDNNHALGKHPNRLLSELLVRLIDFLINIKKYTPATFFKGLVMKYGVDAEYPSNIYESEKLLQQASSLGVNSASIELKRIELFY